MNDALLLDLEGYLIIHFERGKDSEREVTKFFNRLMKKICPATLYGKIGHCLWVYTRVFAKWSLQLSLYVGMTHRNNLTNWQSPIKNLPLTSGSSKKQKSSAGK